jgi:hypothetical protein
VNVRLFAILLFATSMFASQPISLHPVGPTSADRISIHIPVNCTVSDQTVTRTGSLIEIAFHIGAVCDPPVTFAHAVDLEPLPPGQYNVTVNAGGPQLYASGRFVVRNAGPTPFAVHPFAMLQQPSGLRMWIEPVSGQEICPGGKCDTVSITVGDRAVSGITANGVAATFDAPALLPGLYDVTLFRNGVTTTSPAAVYVFDRPDPSVFERVLFPVLDSVSGVNGSRWMTQFTIANPRPWSVENYNTVFPIVCLGYPCGERLLPRHRETFEGLGYPRGVALLVPRPEAKDLSFSLRVRDRSREAEGFGTEVPVVREHDMFRDTTMTLLDVPLDPRYRVKIRMYAFEPFFHPDDQNWRIVTVRQSGRSEQTVFRHRQCSSCATEPVYLDVDVPAGQAGESATIYITPPLESFGWAFASVTNNATQQVTIVTPDGEGGEP